MSERDSRHSASYDADGNIVLPSDGDFSVPFIEQPSIQKEEIVVSFLADEPWESDAYSAPFAETPISVFREVQEKRESARVAIMHAASAATQGAREVMKEGVRQYKTSFQETQQMTADAGAGFRGILRRLWRMLAQPVWVRSGKKHVREYSRGTLFLIDIVRFGGTFAAIFAVLFAAMNYQSFTQIASAKLEIFLEHPSLDDGSSSLDANLTARTASTAVDEGARARGDLFSYLPTVGPPDNRIIIPKLNLNIPLINPAVEALLRQDWAGVEADIQAGLQNGVVHYPGTARPGQAGNFFVTGHSSYYPWADGQYKTVFARLHELDIGDEYWVYHNGDRHRYIVHEKYEIQPSDTTVLDQPADQRIATLMTCTPVGTTLRRLIVRATEVDPITGETLAVGERSEKDVVPKVQLEALPI